MGNCCKKLFSKKINIENEINNFESKTSSLLYAYPSFVNENFTLKDFTIIKCIGKGSFAKVFLVKLNKTNEYFAMKILNKSKLIKFNQINNTKNEVNIFKSVNHPFLTNLIYAFTDSNNIYFISEFMQGGELFFHLSKKKTFKEKEVKFYMSEIFLAIEYLHKKNYIYRDLKPENILIGKDGHIKLTDFGLSKILNKNQNKTYSLVGTFQYLAPEIFINKEEGYDKNCDWFSFGVVMFELFCGYHPFDIRSVYKINKETYEKIKIPSFVGDLAKDLILKLTTFNPKERLGANNEDDIKNHPFFRDINFNDVFNKKIEPPFVPNVESETDLKYFDKEFTQIKIDEQNTNDSNLSTNQNIEFEGFSYKPKDSNLQNND